MKEGFDMLKNLKVVEIELFNYCNRTCGWCPNKYVDRKNKFETLDFHLFINLLQQLKDIDYKGVFSFSRYNEPFAENADWGNATNIGMSFYCCYKLPELKLKRTGGTTPSVWQAPVSDCPSITKFNGTPIDTAGITDLSYFF